jgi:SAM-dependent methyltransferase
MATSEEAAVDRLHPWHRTVLRLLPELNGRKVLEVGCGRGDFARLLGLKYHSSHITATDFSSAAIEHARKKLAATTNVRFEVADAHDLPFPDEEFDYAISCECLEHLEHPAKALSSISRCLRPGGGFIITTENYFNGMILAWLNAWMRRIPFDSGSGVQPRENFFVHWKVRKLIENAGLRVGHMESNHFVWLLLPGFSPATFTTFEVRSRFWRRTFRPFGRHYTYQGKKGN